MKKIKTLFNKAKKESAFKKCGPGHRLTESGGVTTRSSAAAAAAKLEAQKIEPIPERSSGPDENVAKAMLARLETKNPPKATLCNILNEEKEKITMEMKMKEESQKKLKVEEPEIVNPYKKIEDLQRFTCKTLNITDPVPFKDIIPLIKSSIFDMYTDDPILRSAMLMFNCNRSLNQSKTKLENCIELLLKIIRNLMTEDVTMLEKFKRVRQSKIEEKVLSLIGAQDFLFAIGFTVDKDEPDFLVYDDEDGMNIQTKMNYLVDLLSNPQVIPIELDRQVHEVNTNMSNAANEDDSDLNLTSNEVKYYVDNLERERKIHEMFASKKSKEKLLSGNLQSNFQSIFTRLRFRINIMGEMKIFEAMFYSKETLADVKLWFKTQYGSMLGQKDFQFKSGLDLLVEDSATLTALKLSPVSTLIVI